MKKRIFILLLAFVLMFDCINVTAIASALDSDGDAVGPEATMTDLGSEPTAQEPEITEEPVVPEPFYARVRIELQQTGDLYYGDEVVLHAAVEANADEYAVEWQYYNEAYDPEDEKSEEWIVCGSGKDLRFTVTEENAKRIFRAVVNGAFVSEQFVLPAASERPTAVPELPSPNRPMIPVDDVKQDTPDEDEGIMPLALVESTQTMVIYAAEERNINNGGGFIIKDGIVFMLTIAGAPVGAEISLDSEHIDFGANKPDVPLSGNLYYVVDESNPKQYKVAYLKVDTQVDGVVSAYVKGENGDPDVNLGELPGSGKFVLVVGMAEEVEQYTLSVYTMTMSTTYKLGDEQGDNYQNKVTAGPEYTLEGSGAALYGLYGKSDDVFELNAHVGEGEYYYGTVVGGNVTSISNETITAVRYENGDRYLRKADDSEFVDNDSDIIRIYDKIYSFELYIKSMTNEYSEDTGDLHLWRGTRAYINTAYYTNNDRPYKPNPVIPDDLGQDAIAYDRTDNVYEYEKIVITGRVGDSFAVNEPGIDKLVIYVQDTQEFTTDFWFNPRFVFDTVGWYREDIYCFDNYLVLNAYEQKVNFFKMTEDDQGNVSLKVQIPGKDNNLSNYDITEIKNLYVARDPLIVNEYLKLQAEHNIEHVQLRVASNLAISAPSPDRTEERIYSGIMRMSDVSFTIKFVDPDTNLVKDGVDYADKWAEGISGIFEMPDSDELQVESNNMPEFWTHYQLLSVPVSDAVFDPNKMDIRITYTLNGILKYIDDEGNDVYFNGDIFIDGTRYPIVQGVLDLPALTIQLQEKDLRKAYELCPRKRGFDIYIDVGTAVKIELAPDTPLVVAKIWEDEFKGQYNYYGKRPESMTVLLERYMIDEFGSETRDDDFELEVELTGGPTDEVWLAELMDMPFFSDDGRSYSYRIVEGSESSFDGDQYYEPTIGSVDGDPDNQLQLTNTFVKDHINVQVTKRWVDENGNPVAAPNAEVEIGLYQNDQIYAVAKLNAANNWTYLFENVPLFVDREDAVYTVYELDENDEKREYGVSFVLDGKSYIAGVQETIPGAAADVDFDITNTLMPVDKSEKIVTANRGEGDRALVMVGDVIEYTISWKNANDDDAFVVIKDTLEAGLTHQPEAADATVTYADGTTQTATFTVEGSTLVWKFVAPAQTSGTVSFKAKVNEAAVADGKYDVENDADVGVKVGEEPAGDEFVRTKKVRNPIPYKTEEDPGNTKPVIVGQEITYRVYWENAYDEAKEMLVLDALDIGLDYVNGSASDAMLLNGTAIAGTVFTSTYGDKEDVLAWTFTAAGGARGYVEFKAIVNEKALEKGDLTVYNQASVQVGEDPAVDTNIVENPVDVPKKTEKIVTANRGEGDRALVMVGDVIEYSISWQNTNTKAANVVIKDTLEAGLTHQPEAADATVTYADGTTQTATFTVEGSTLVWKFVAPAQTSGTVSFKAKVNEAAVADGKYDVENDADVGVKVGEEPAGDEFVRTKKVRNPIPYKTEEDPGNTKPVIVGQEITYRVYWENAYDEAKEMQVLDALDIGLDYVNGSASDAMLLNDTAIAGTVFTSTYGDKEDVLAWTFTAAGGARGYVEFKAIVNEKALEKGDLTVYNQASVKVGEDPAVDTNIVENPVDIPKKTEKIVTANRGEGDRALVMVGDVIEYTISWKNANGDDAFVVIKDTLEAGLTHQPEAADATVSYADGTTQTATFTVEGSTLVWKFVAPAETSGTVSFKAKVNEAAVADGKYDVENDADVGVKVGEEPAGDEFVRTKKVRNPIPYKTEADPGNTKPVIVGQEITYRVYWENAYDEAKEMLVLDALDVGLDYVEGSASDAMLLNGTAIAGTVFTSTYGDKEDVLAWTFTAAGGARGYVEFKAIVNEKALEKADLTVYNQASVQVGEDPAVDTNIVENPVDVPKKTEKIVTANRGEGDRALVMVGDVIEYSISWQNTNTKAANVVIKDALEAGLTHQPEAADATVTYADGTTQTATFTVEGSTLMWKFVAPAQTSGTVSFKAKVNEVAVADGKYDVENDADVGVKVGEEPAGDEFVRTKKVRNPIPYKTEEDPGNTKPVIVGQEITYRVYWENAYDEAKEMLVLDALDVGLDYVNGSASDAMLLNGTAIAGTVFTSTYGDKEDVLAWTFTAAGGARGYVEFKAIVNKKALEKADLTVYNQASVQVGEDPAVDTNIVKNPVSPGKFKLVKAVSGMTGSNGHAKVGDKLTYTITVSNTGNVALKGLKVTDTSLLPDITNTTTTKGVTYKGNGVWTIAELAIGGSVKITYTYVVKSTDVKIINVATVEDPKHPDDPKNPNPDHTDRTETPVQHEGTQPSEPDHTPKTGDESNLLMWLLLLVLSGLGIGVTVIYSRRSRRSVK